MQGCGKLPAFPYCAYIAIYVYALTRDHESLSPCRPARCAVCDARKPCRLEGLRPSPGVILTSRPVGLRQGDGARTGLRPTRTRPRAGSTKRGAARLFCSVQRERKANECHGQRPFCPLMATCAASESEKFSCAAKAAFVSGEAAKPKGSGGLSATGEPTAQDRTRPERRNRRQAIRRSRPVRGRAAAPNIPERALRRLLPLHKNLVAP